MTSVATIVQKAVLTAKEKLKILRVELAVKSANAPSQRNFDGNVFATDQRDFFGNIESRPGRDNLYVSLWDLASTCDFFIVCCNV